MKTFVTEEFLSSWSVPTTLQRTDDTQELSGRKTSLRELPPERFAMIVSNGESRTKNRLISLGSG